MGEGRHRAEYDPDVPSADPPSRPARDDRVVLVPPARAPRLGKGGSPESRVAILHSLAHIESWAIDLSWDIVARFGAARSMPRAFFDDFVQVAADEARHPGMLPPGSWSSGPSTAPSTRTTGSGTRRWRRRDRSRPGSSSSTACTRLAVSASCRRRLKSFGETATSNRHSCWRGTIYPEEVTHCAAGVRWFKYLHERDGDERRTKGGAGGGEGEGGEAGSGEEAVARAFHETVWAHFKGVLKPPFNEEARDGAGFGRAWYMPLTKRPAVAGAGAQTRVKNRCFGFGYQSSATENESPRDLQTVFAVDEQAVVFRRHELHLVKHPLAPMLASTAPSTSQIFSYFFVIPVLLNPG